MAIVVRDAEIAAEASGPMTSLALLRDEPVQPSTDGHVERLVSARISHLHESEQGETGDARTQLQACWTDLTVAPSAPRRLRGFLRAGRLGFADGSGSCAS